MIFLLLLSTTSIIIITKLQAEEPEDASQHTEDEDKKEVLAETVTKDEEKQAEPAVEEPKTEVPKPAEKPIAPAIPEPKTKEEPPVTPPEPPTPPASPYKKYISTNMDFSFSYHADMGETKVELSQEYDGPSETITFTNSRIVVMGNPIGSGSGGGNWTSDSYELTNLDGEICSCTISHEVDLNIWGISCKNDKTYIGIYDFGVTETEAELQYLRTRIEYIVKNLHINY